MPRKHTPEFRTDPESLRKYLAPKQPGFLESAESISSEYEETLTEHGVTIGKHVPTGAKYIENGGFKIWLFPYEKTDEESVKFRKQLMGHLEGIAKNIDSDGYGSTDYVSRTGLSVRSRQKMFMPWVVSRMITEDGAIFARGEESLIPEEQRRLFGYAEHAELFSGPQADNDQSVKAAIYLCLLHKIPSRYVSDLVKIFPPRLYKMARLMGNLTFDYSGKFKEKRIPVEYWVDRHNVRNYFIQREKRRAWEKAQTETELSENENQKNPENPEDKNRKQ